MPWDFGFDSSPINAPPAPSWSEQVPQQAQQQPYRVLSTDEALGPATGWDALRKKAPMVRPRTSGWDMVSSAAVHIANGVAAATGMPAWIRAQHSLNKDVEMSQRMDAMQMKAHQDYLRELQKQQDQEEGDRAKYALHPMVEMDGQRMPESDAISLTEHRLTADYRDKELGLRQEGLDESKKSRWANFQRNTANDEYKQKEKEADASDRNSFQQQRLGETKRVDDARLGIARERLAFDKSKPGGAKPTKPLAMGATDYRELWREADQRLNWTGTPKKIRAEVQKLIDEYRTMYDDGSGPDPAGDGLPDDLGP